MPRTPMLLLLSACLLSACAPSTRAYVTWPTPPASTPCRIKLLPERELTRPEAEARIVDAEERVALCEIERRKLLEAWPVSPPPPAKGILRRK